MNINRKFIGALIGKDRQLAGLVLDRARVVEFIHPFKEKIKLYYYPPTLPGEQNRRKSSL